MFQADIDLVNEKVNKMAANQSFNKVNGFRKSKSNEDMLSKLRVT